MTTPMTSLPSQSTTTPHRSESPMSNLLRSVACAALIAAPAAAQIPEHPDALAFPVLQFEPPEGVEYRHELSSGVPVYVVPSDEFPLVNVQLVFKGGAYLEPGDATGTAATLGAMMRRGGTETLSPDELDERLDYLAANVSTSVGSETSSASIDCLKSNLDEAFALFMDVLLRPGYDAERLRVHKEQMIEGMKQRNDNPMSVAMSSMRRLVYGEEHYSGRETTIASIESITPESMAALHGRIFHPGNLIVAVTGDVEVDAMLTRLDKAFEGWEAGPRNDDPPAPAQSTEPALYHARTSQAELPQGTTIMIGPGIQRDDPDALAIQVMNDILGGGGFTSRITNRVRSDEGLAYTAQSFFQSQIYYKGLFGAFYQSKNRTVAKAARIVLEEVERIRAEPVTDDELSTAKNALIERFPRRFASKSAMLGVFVNDEMTGRDPNHWRTYRDRVESIDSDTVLRVAVEHIDPSNLSMLVVGDWDEIGPGDTDVGGSDTMAEFFDGEVVHLPMLDPLTREPMDEDKPTID